MITGIPLHPLIVHLSVIAVPVAALLLIWAAFRPVSRWLLTALTGIGFISTALTNNTGEKLMVLKGASEEAPGIYADHALYAKFVVISAFVMFACAAGGHFLLAKEKLPQLVLVLRVLGVLAALVALVSVVMTGHEGARLVWTQG